MTTAIKSLRIALHRLSDSFKTQVRLCCSTNDMKKTYSIWTRSAVEHVAITCPTEGYPRLQYGSAIRLFTIYKYKLSRESQRHSPET